MYNLFISHSWAYSDSYDRLIFLLNNAQWFEYKNYSVPRSNPIHNAPSPARLREAIRAQMSPASVIVILAGVYSTYSTWINEEIDLAMNGFMARKPILAVEPFGSQRTSMVVKNAADRIVSWNTNSIVSGIRDLS
ncbi:molecular chaperone Tir [Kaistia algarum]|uniref:TIR domain-containing protein n=1 Tax=Kaistia algarum TaxID=2083279 RepID=UPI000CE81619|nr:molecular chaperone Tir [Kaistia algarum]